MIMHITAGSLPGGIGLTRNKKKWAAAQPLRTPPPRAARLHHVRRPAGRCTLSSRRRLTHRCKLEEAKGEETTDWSYQSTD